MYVFIESSDVYQQSASIDFKNDENFPVFIRAASGQNQQDENFQFSPVLIDGKTTKLVYVTFPGSLTEFALKAYKMEDPIMINSKDTFKVKPGQKDQVLSARIHQRGTTAL